MPIGRVVVIVVGFGNDDDRRDLWPRTCTFLLVFWKLAAHKDTTQPMFAVETAKTCILHQQKQQHKTMVEAHTSCTT